VGGAKEKKEKKKKKKKKKKKRAETKEKDKKGERHAHFVGVGQNDGNNNLMNTRLLKQETGEKRPGDWGPGKKGGRGRKEKRRTKKGKFHWN